MSQADRIVSRFGGANRAAELLVVPLTTVRSWVKVGLIPVQRHQAILDAARAAGIKLRPADFFDPPHRPRKAEFSAVPAA